MALIDDVKSLKEQGMTVAQIAEQLGIPYFLARVLYNRV